MNSVRPRGSDACHSLPPLQPSCCKGAKFITTTSTWPPHSLRQQHYTIQQSLQHTPEAYHTTSGILHATVCQQSSSAVYAGLTGQRSSQKLSSLSITVETKIQTTLLENNQKVQGIPVMKTVALLTLLGRYRTERCIFPVEEANCLKLPRICSHIPGFNT